MPAVNGKADRLQRLSALLDEALDLDEPAREAWLSSLGGEEADLGPTLRGMLAREAGGGTADLLNRPLDFVASRVEAITGDLAAGDRIGPYRLLELLGRGGMGEVWLAERPDGQPARKVALKLPMLGLRRAVLVQRFARERDILASLEHPHIARLYDAGLADDGQPYLALEYVAGLCITDYAQQHRLGTRERVLLMRQVMRAVQFAHANLVIHRDIKPGNVLVTAQGQAMLLDFGIAKLLQDDRAASQETELTQLGGRALTLDYAAPEQVAGQPVSIATDVYALGVLLYELLTGRRPFSGPRHVLEQAVLTQTPARPAGLPSDLGTIVQKALRKLPAERYATVDAFSDDLGRWLRGDPVLAQPDQLGYRARKFLARHRLPVAVGALTGLALLTAGVVALWQADQARQEAARARQEARRAQAVQDFLLELFQTNGTEQADPQAAQRTTARELLDRGAARIDQALADQPQSRIEVLRTLADTYSQLGLEPQARQLQRRRVELARQTYRRDDARLGPVLLEYVASLQDSDRRGEIPALLDEAGAVLGAAGAREEPAWGELLLNKARYWRYESLPRALQGAEEAAAFFRRTEPASTGLLTAQLLVARVHLAVHNPAAAEAPAREAVALAERQQAGATAWRVTPLITLAAAQEERLDLPSAEASLRQALADNTHLFGETHLDTLQSRARLGNLLVGVGRTAEGQALLDAVQSALRAGSVRMEEARRAQLAGLTGESLVDRGRPDRALPLWQAEIAGMRVSLPRLPLLVRRERALAEAQAALGDLAGARQTLAAAEARWADFASGVASPGAQSSFALSHARLALAGGEAAAALAWIERAPPAAGATPIALDIVRAQALLALKRPAEALDAAQAAWSRLDGLPAAGRPVALTADALMWRGLVLRQLGEMVAAQHSLQRALALRRAHDLAGSRAVARLEALLAGR